LLGGDIAVRRAAGDRPAHPPPGARAGRGRRAGRRTVVEMWQANGAGRYVHPNTDDHAPPDPNFMAPRAW